MFTVLLIIGFLLKAAGLPGNDLSFLFKLGFLSADDELRLALDADLTIADGFIFLI